ncbi:MAG: c-type cytochrome [Gemmatimonadaceae bacterium]|jgi:cytochrome c oxidase cbb3-type subunit 3|nr:c-type cytochrome [Gemmatimonadaceae bacterium]
MTPDPKGPAPHGTDDLLLDHEYDGIKEYDNPMPKWWLYGFYASMVFGLLYWLKVPGTGGNESVIAEYRADSTQAAAVFAQAEANKPRMGDADLVAMVGDARAIAAGKETFTKMCASCHRADGGGMIGPNLADAYWLHVKSASDIITVINEGVTAKGMPAWNAVLKPAQVNDVSAYVLSLQGTAVANGKAPQGDAVTLTDVKAPVTGAAPAAPSATIVPTAASEAPTAAAPANAGGRPTASREATASGG